MCEKAGADGLELNVSCPHGMPERGMGALLGQNPYLVKRITRAVKQVVDIPVWVKLTPNVTDIGLIARAAASAGADGLVGINTVKALGGIDIDTFTPRPSVSRLSAFGGYSGAAIKPIALRCVAEIVQAVDPSTDSGVSEAEPLPVSAVGGISDWRDAVEFMLLGASTVQVCTAALYRPDMISGLKTGLLKYLKRHRFNGVDSIVRRGLDKVLSHLDLTFDPLEI
jgi:dihydropyrimidine dehydrogenase (NAD+) subunit PreA